MLMVNPSSSRRAMMPQRVTIQKDDRSKVERVEYPNQKAVMDMCEELAQEAGEYIGSGTAGKADRLTLVQMWERNGKRFLGDHWSKGGEPGGGGLQEGHRVFHIRDDGTMGKLQRVTLNRIQPGVIAAWASQTAADHVVRFVPEQTADKPRVWLTKSGGRKLQAMIASEIATYEAAKLVAAEAQQPEPDAPPLATITPQQLGDKDNHPTERLNEEQSAMVVKMLQEGVLTPDDATLLNDDYLARGGQKMFDNRWRRANGNRAVTINSFLCGIFGHQPMRVQYHDRGPKKNDFTLENTHILNVWIDPTMESIDQAAYVGFEYLLSLDQALAAMPRSREYLERAARSGNLNHANRRFGAVYHKVNFKRQMVRVRVVWLRDQELQMSAREAVATGRVKEVHEPEFNELGEPVLDEAGQPAFKNTGQYMTVPDVRDWGFDGLDAEELEEMIGQPEPTKPGMANWPTKLGLREIVSLPDVPHLVRDGECAYSDIPFGWNINIPIMYSPFGQGEPQRVEDVQQQINRLLTIFGNYMGLFAHPVRYWRASTLEHATRLGVNLGTAPGQNVPIPDEDYRELIRDGGRVNLQADVAVMPPLMMDILSLLLREMDRTMGHVDAVQGAAPSGVKSGIGIQALQSAARGPQAAKAKFTEWMVERVAKLMMDGIVRWVDDEVWEKILELPLPVIRDMRELMAEREFNFYCSVATGRGTNEEREEERAITLYAGGAPGRLYSRRTAMEKVRIPNPEDEEKRIRKEDAETAAAMAAAAQPAAPPGAHPVAA